ncbi:MAG: phosphate/phosphite/phosphonate ABC transporter substrate-binding protein [Deltaproteobacteria bacterium]|nr:phosphate/phosphite/phosphonate ABC transporter substrate-binding protein [Deltaproteobacteria bacterium]NCP02622.1 phosphate/phosphite/phosphonate ABC transporter substrate-binding protein [Deltaproteobacteria bacterium]
MRLLLVICSLLLVVGTFLLGSSGVGHASDAEQKPVVYFGIIPRYNPMLMYRSYQPLMDYLTEHTSYHFELKLARDYTEAVALLRVGVTPIASLGDVTFTEAQRNFGAIPILKPLNARGEPFYRSVIIVPEDSPIRTLADLKGKTFAFGDPHSTSGNLIPRYLLFQHGITLFDLEEFVNLGSHDAVAKAVLKGKYAAGAVKDVIAYRYKQHGLRFLAESDPIPSVPIVVRADASVALVKAVNEALLTIDAEDPVQREQMKSWDPEFRNGFVAAERKDYLPIFQLMDNVRGGCGIRCH